MTMEHLIPKFHFWGAMPEGLPNCQSMENHAGLGLLLYVCDPRNSCISVTILTTLDMISILIFLQHWGAGKLDFVVFYTIPIPLA